MFGGRTEYDHGVNTFSPEGRIFQIEYARKAANLGSAGIGICIKDGVVLAVERRISSPLIVASSIEKIFEIDHHVAAVVSGMTADAKSLVEYARVEAQNHRFTYNEPIPVEAVTLSVCDLSLRFGEGGSKKKRFMSRPYGVALLVAGIDTQGAQLWATDPSGTYWRYEAHAIGAGAEGARTTLRNQYNPEMSLDEACCLTLSILGQIMEDKISSTNIEIAIITRESAHIMKLESLKIENLIEKMRKNNAMEEYLV